jgi:hypothetical protein
MAHHTRRQDWMSGPLAERMSFSSFGHSVDDIWAHKIERPYQIILMPGYTVPASLDRGDKDALWPHMENVAGGPLIVWDGFSATALFEIIRECFDYDGDNRFIKVLDAKTRKPVKDERDPKILEMRPRRKSNWGPRQIRNHMVELCVWSSMMPAGNETHKIYTEIASSHGDSRTDSLDSYTRAEMLMEKGLTADDLIDIRDKINKDADDGTIRLRRGVLTGGPVPGTDPSRKALDDDVELLDTTMKGSSGLAEISVADFSDGIPDSFYRFASRKGQSANSQRREKYSASFPDEKKPLFKWPWKADKNPF